MKKQFLPITILLVLALITFAKPAGSNIAPLNIIIAISGNVQIKRPQWTGYQPISVGTSVNSSDTLILTKGASAQVQCTNLDLWQLVSPGEFPISQGCPFSSRPILRRPDTNTTFTRAGNNPKQPYPISPRNTKVFTNRPKLRWNQVAGVTNYQVRLFGPPGFEWEDKNINQPHIIYSGDKPLNYGDRYWFTVTGEKYSSTEKSEYCRFYCHLSKRWSTP